MSYTVEFEEKLNQITVRSDNLNLEFKGDLQDGKGFQGFLSLELLIDALKYELETKETSKFDVCKDFSYVIFSFYLGEFRKEKKYFVIKLTNTYKSIIEKIEELDETSDSQDEGHAELPNNFPDLVKEVQILKRQNKLLIKSISELEKINYQNKMLEISRNMPEVPYLSFTYPEWSTFEEFKKLKGFEEISAAYNFKNYIIGYDPDKSVIFINESENKIYYVGSGLNKTLIDDKYCGKILANIYHNHGEDKYNNYYKDIIDNPSYINLPPEITSRFSSSCFIKQSEIKGMRNYCCNKFRNFMGLFRIGFLLLNPKYYDYKLEYKIDFSNTRPIINLYIKNKFKYYDYEIAKLENKIVYKKLVMQDDPIYVIDNLD